MKKIVQKSILIGIAYYLLVLVNACCNCNWVKNQEYRFTGLHTQNTTYTFAADSVNSTLSNADTFRKDTYGFELHFAYLVLAKAGNGVHALFNSAYACKCRTDSFVASTKIDKITIRTVHDFDERHPAGSDVTGFFSYVSYSQNPYQLSYEGINTRKGDLSSMEAGNQVLYIPCYLRSSQKPGTLLQFEVTVDYLDKTVHQVRTQPVIIQ